MEQIQLLHHRMTHSLQSVRGAKVAHAPFTVLMSEPRARLVAWALVPTICGANIAEQRRDAREVWKDIVLLVADLVI